ncbi:DUF1064 domain-containing protein [Acinetobacter thermotolerans]|uniref:DUF1064 domain-containing protein n=1 Tax=Acinetobacter thermotolerans TaxID=3151487 RepID=UPI00325A6B12
MPVRMTPEQLRRAGLGGRFGTRSKSGSVDSKKKTPKYHNQKTEKDGHKFDSLKEARRYKQLALMEKEGIIQDLRLQVPFVLAPSVRFKSEERAKPDLRYFADFVYMKNGEQIVEDVKSKITRDKAEYRIKKHLMMSVHGIEISEV